MKTPYGLALGGGSAIGLVHIGVIKYIEENNIDIKEVSGTSMGSIIAGLFAIGKTSEEITEFAKSIAYFKLIDFDLRSGVIKGNKIYKLLHDIFGDKLIENTNIKLKIVATNIDTGGKKVFEKGKIVDAIRASISLPGIFSPHKIGEEYFIDGGFSNNLPIEVLRRKNIIAVSALKTIEGPVKRKKKIFGFSFKTGFFNRNFQVLQRSFLILMKQNEDRSRELKTKNIIYIGPNTKGYDIYDFDKVDELVECGYGEMVKKFKKNGHCLKNK